MERRPLIFARVVWCLLVIIVPREGFASGAECPQSLWLSLGERTRLSDGSLSQRYHLRRSGTGWPEDTLTPQLQAFYRLSGRNSSGQGLFPAPVTCREGDCSLDIRSTTFARFEVYVVGTCGQRRFMAQTVQTLFGKSSIAQPSVSESFNDPLMDLPQLSLTPSPSDYYMQTGRNYQFNYSGLGGGGVTVAVIEEHQRPVMALTMHSTGDFTYTPPHDARLDRLGQQAFKETVLLIEEFADNRQYATTFTLALHRSRLAHMSLLPGIGLFSLTAIVVLALVLALKKRPWYRLW